ncbi:MotA/TolQ/ExbB proton channel family protein [bacterium]|nr:MotA/TolQ/ExbB proton channel family protein [bacterium]
MDTLKTIVDLSMRGGPLMVPLALVALAALALVIERFLYLRANRIDGDRFHFELKTALKDGDLPKAIVLAARTRGVVGRVVEEGLLRVQDGETDVEAATEKVIHNEMSQVERSRGWLVNLAQVAPLLGILGTVQGMVLCFMRIEQSGATDPKMLAGGIYVALITTVAGLAIAVPVTVAQEYFRNQTNQILHYLDLCLLEVREWMGHRRGSASHHGQA